MKSRSPFYISSLLLLLTVFYKPPVVRSQSVPLIQYKKEQGLPSDVVYSIIRDRSGYLWLGTDKGLCRFNGYSFKTFTTLDGLPDNEVFSCAEDIQGRLWLVTFKGDLCFLEDNVFHTAANTPWLKLPPSSDHFFSQIVPEADSSFSMVSSNGMSFINVKDSLVKLYDANKIFAKIDSRIVHIKKLSPDRFCLYTNSFQIITDSSLNLLSKKAASYSLGYSGRQFFLLNEKGIWDINDHLLLDAGSTGHYKWWNNHPVFFLDKNRFWIGKKTDLYLNNQSIFQGRSKPITYIERDIFGNYWIGSRGDGIYKISRFFDGIQVLRNAYLSQVVSAERIKGTVYFITESGQVNTFASGTVKKIAQLTRRRETQLTPDNLYISDQGEILQVFDGQGTCLIPDITRTAHPACYTLSFPSVADARGAKAIIPGKEHLYIFTMYDIARIDIRDIIKTRQIKQDFLLNMGPRGSKRIYAKAIDPQTNDIWYSRKDGVYKMANRVPYLQKQLSPFNFRQFEFYGSYLVGITDNSKLIIINSADKSAKWDSTQSNNSVWEHIYRIDERHAIISTNNYYRLLTLYPAQPSGAPRYALKTIETSAIPQEAEYILADPDTCLFFKEGTITKVETRLLFEQIPPPKPLFSSFKATGKSYPLRPRITIPYSESKNINLIFDNIALNGNDITCEYSISKEGKEDWLAITGNEINLNTPGFGDYTIKIRSKTISSNYSKPAIIHLTILKPFWATWWFITLAILLLIALVWAIVLIAIWYRLRKKQKEHDADMKYQQSEYKALNALMNPHFIFNSLNNIQGLINKDEKRVANEYLVIFSDLVRQNMNNISKGFITLQQELNLVENYLTLEKLRFKDLVNYEIQVADDVETEDIMIPPLMIQPLVENAVKHGLLPKQSTENMVRIHVFERDDLLYVEITDNGVGLLQSLKNKNKLHESFGLVNLKKRTEHLKKIQQQEMNIEIKEIIDGEGHSKGTRALITMVLDNV